MKRSVHILVSLTALVVLLRPLDCFALFQSTPQTMECCLKGKCAPTAKSDSCCSAAPASPQFPPTQAGAHSVPLAVVATVLIAPAVAPPSLTPAADSYRHPPPESSLLSRNLPLLI